MYLHKFSSSGIAVSPITDFNHWLGRASVTCVNTDNSIMYQYSIFTIFSQCNSELELPEILNQNLIMLFIDGIIHCGILINMLKILSTILNDYCKKHKSNIKITQPLTFMQ